MNRDDIESIARRQAFPDKNGEAEIVETHANWIVLSEHFAFKIKKELRFSFLDYTTLEKRKFFCERELALNQRLTRNIYLRVIPVCQSQEGPMITSAGAGPVIDYAVQMQRMDGDHHMSLMLEKGQVRHEHIRQIARMLARFHKQTEKIKRKVVWMDILEDFSDITSTHNWVENNLGKKEAELLHAIVLGVGKFLERMESHLQYRNERGFTVDGHGDLHSRNIFLLDPPVLFDCIEFNDHFRQLDVLDEVAFLFMDLCFHRRPDFAEYLLSEYLESFPAVEGPPDRALFYYYLCYRANVRFKVSALLAEQTASKEKAHEAHLYWNLLKEYFILFQKRGWF